jgi:ribosomal protein L11 methyltransferase
MNRMVALAPRIRLYPMGSPRPELEPGWLALAQHAQDGAAGVVFGDGSHPTTRLCAAVVDQLCRQRQPGAVLDVGTGTGVLARIARARGATFVVGTDIDAGALASAAANSALDAQSIAVSREAPDFWGARFDLVVANILEEPLRQLAPALKRALAGRGVLVISGFTRVQVPAIRLHYGMRGVGESYLGEWGLLVLERGPQSPGG